MASQNVNGGWGRERLFESGIATPYLIEALSGRVEYQETVQKGIAWLIETQNRDGSWGPEQDPFIQLHFTARSLAALSSIAAGGFATIEGDLETTLSRAARYLIERQEEDGSWLKGIFLVTSEATLALSSYHTRIRDAEQGREIEEAIGKANSFLLNELGEVYRERTKEEIFDSGFLLFYAPALMKLPQESRDDETIKYLQELKEYLVYSPPPQPRGASEQVVTEQLLWGYLCLISNADSLGSDEQELLFRKVRTLLIERQLWSGGWAKPGSTVISAIAIQLLSSLQEFYPDDEEIERALERALSWAVKLQAEDGSWILLESSDPISTSMAVSYLLKAYEASGNTAYLNVALSGLDWLKEEWADYSCVLCNIFLNEAFLEAYNITASEKYLDSSEWLVISTADIIPFSDTHWVFDTKNESANGFMVTLVFQLARHGRVDADLKTRAEETVSWLLGNQNPDGSWGNREDAFLATFAVSNAFLEKDELDSGGYNALIKGVDWLNGASLSAGSEMAPYQEAMFRYIILTKAEKRGFSEDVANFERHLKKQRRVLETLLKTDDDFVLITVLYSLAPDSR